MVQEKGPAPLLDFEQERTFNKVWSTSVGDGWVISLIDESAVDGNLIYVASAKGVIEAITFNWASVWSTELASC